MTRRSRRRPLLFTWLLAATACAAGETRPVVEIGKPAPAYGAATLDGRQTSLGDFAGKVILLNVWATWCAPCREEIPYLQSLHDQNASRGLVIVGVSVDARGSERSIEQFRDDFGMTYPIWHDPDERVQTLYLALGVPATYLIDRDGILRWRHLGTVKPTDAIFVQALEHALTRPVATR